MSKRTHATSADDAAGSAAAVSAAAGHVLVGHVAGAHGVRGEVLIKSYTDVAEDIATYGVLQTEQHGAVEIKRCRASKKGVVASFRGVSGRAAAEAFKGAKLFAPRERFPDTDDDEWYVTDLIGLDVRDTRSVVIGAVVAVQDFGAGALVEVRLDGNAKTVFVPFTREDVPDVQLGDGFIVVDLARVTATDDDPDVRDADEINAGDTRGSDIGEPS
ncbi:MAG: ribosome maturation factor RimM [Pseudomonadota bacterium]